jgi:hypothetical protein
VNLIGVSRIRIDSVIVMWIVHDASADVLRISLMGLLEHDPVWDAYRGRFASNPTRSTVVGTQLHVIYLGVEKVFNLDADSGNIWDPCVGFKRVGSVDYYDREEYKKMKFMVTSALTLLVIKGHSFL